MVSLEPTIKWTKSVRHWMDDRSRRRRRGSIFAARSDPTIRTNGLLMNAAEDSYNKNRSFLVKIVKHLLPLLLLILPEDDLREWAEFAMGLILSRCIAPVSTVPSS